MHCIATHSTSQHIFLKLTTLFATYLRLVSWTPSVPETPSFNSTNINIIAFHLCAPPLRAHFHCALTVADYAPVCNIHLCSSLVEHKRWWWLRAIISLRSEIYWVTHNHTIHMSSWVESDTTTFVCNPFVHCYCKWILKITLAFVGCRIEAICIYHKRTVETRSRVTQSQWTKHRTHTDCGTNRSCTLARAIYTVQTNYISVNSCSVCMVAACCLCSVRSACVQSITCKTNRIDCLRATTAVWSLIKRHGYASHSIESTCIRGDGDVLCICAGVTISFVAARCIIAHRCATVVSTVECGASSKQAHRCSACSHTHTRRQHSLSKMP